MGIQVSAFDDGIFDEDSTANIFPLRHAGDVKLEDEGLISKGAQYNEIDYDEILGEAREAVQSPSSVPPNARMFIPNQSGMLSRPDGHEKADASHDVSSHKVYEKSFCDFREDRTQIDPDQISERESCYRILDEAEKASFETLNKENCTEYDEKDISDAVAPSIAPPEEMYATYYDRSEKTCAVPHEAVADIPVTVFSHTVISKHACSSDPNKQTESPEIVERHKTYPGRTCNFVPSEELEAIEKEHKRNFRSIYYKSMSTKT